MAEALWDRKDPQGDGDEEQGSEVSDGQAGHADGDGVPAGAEAEEPEHSPVPTIPHRHRSSVTGTLLQWLLSQSVQL